MDGGDQMYLTGDFIPESKIVSLPNFGGELVLANLEGPVCSADLKKGLKVGEHLRSSTFELKGRWAFALANNHIMDYGYDGLKQTCEFLESKGIKYCGTGTNDEERRKPIILDESGYKIAVFSCCERQFGIADKSTPGCAEMGMWLYSSVREIKQSNEVDYVIVSCHAASEFSPWVSPKLRSFYQSLIDAGADVIHGHHSHVPQGYEVYKNRPIFYGLGNFVVDVDMWTKNPNFLWSLGVNIKFGKDGIIWSPVFIGLRKDGETLSAFFLEGKALEVAKEYIEMTNVQFECTEKCIACWQEASVALYSKIYAPNTRIWFSVKHKIPFRERLKLICFATFDIMSALLGCSYPKNRSQCASKVGYNIFCCPSHIDMISTYLGLSTGVEKDYRSDETKCLACRLGMY